MIGKTLKQLIEEGQTVTVKLTRAFKNSGFAYFNKNNIVTFTPLGFGDNNSKLNFRLNDTTFNLPNNFDLANTIFILI